MSRISKSQVAVLLAIGAIAPMQLLDSRAGLAETLGNGVALGLASIAASDGSGPPATTVAVDGIAIGASAAATTGTDPSCTDNCGNGNIAIGGNSLANRDFALAVGFNSVAGGDRSSAYGVDSAASNLHSSAFGVSSIASGNGSAGYGDSSKAAGDDSVAVGFNANAVASASVAAGGLWRSQHRKRR
jgi:hypothetical protein